MKVNQYFNKVDSLWSEIDNTVEAWSKLESNQLKRKPGNDKWSALECIDHLNQTYKIYIPNLEKAIRMKKGSPSTKYKSGLFGNMMINSVSSKKNGKANMPMKTFSFFEPGLNDDLDKEAVISKFKESHKKMEGFISQAKELNINKTKVQSALSWLKLRLGVCLLFLLNHGLRHINQGKRAMNNS